VHAAGLFLLLAFAAGWLGLVWLGFPNVAVRHALRRLNRGPYVLETAGVTLDVPGRIVARDVAVYRKGLVGPPVAAIREVRLRFDPLGWLLDRRFVRDVEVYGARVETILFESWAPAPRAPALPRFTGGFGVWDSEVTGVRVRRLEGQLVTGPDGARFEGVHGEVGDGGAAGGHLNGAAAWSAAGGWRGRLALALDPVLCVPLARAAGATNLCALVDRFRFGRTPPEVNLEFEGWGPQAPAFRLSGRFHGNNFGYLGAPVTFANLQFAVSNTAAGATAVLRPVVLVLGNGTATGFAELDFVRNTVRFEAASTADPALLARVVELAPSEWFDWTRWGGSTRLYAKGVVGLASPSGTEVHGRVEGTDLGLGRVRAEVASFSFDVLGPTNVIRDVQGRLYGGTFTGSGLWVQPADAAEEGPFELKGEVIHADFAQVMRATAGAVEAEYEGRLYGRVELVGRLGRPDTLAGQGYLSMRDGRVFRIPLFGGLTEPLAAAVPGVDFALRQTDVRIPFEVREGAVVCREAAIEGDVLSLTGAGRVALADGALDFRVQARPLKGKTVAGQTARVLAAPVSKLLEFELRGTAARPEWKAVNLPIQGVGPGRKESP
jgi:hypothetical protein